MVTVWSDSEYVILAEGTAGCHIEDGAVAIQILLFRVMPMPVQAEHQTRKLVNVIVEHLRHIIVKLLRVGSRMHAHHGAVEIGGIGRTFRLHEVEVRHRARVIVLDGIGVEAYELHPSGYETEIRVSEDDLIRLVARSQTVVVAQQYHRRHLQFLQSVAGPFHLSGSPEVRDVAAMNHEIDAILSAVDIVHLGFQVVEPLVAIADYGKSDGILALHRLFNLSYILGIYVGFTVHPHIVGVYVEHGIASPQHHHTRDAAEAGAQGVTFIE